jgi:hypothetical protein
VTTPAEPTREAKRALVFVALFRRKHGYGPTWRELGEAIGWTRREQRNRQIPQLYAYGLRWRRGVTRSLDVPEWALRRVLRSPDLERRP